MFKIVKEAEILVGSIQNINKWEMRESVSINKTDLVLFTVHSLDQVKDDN